MKGYGEVDGSLNGADVMYQSCESDALLHPVAEKSDEYRVVGSGDSKGSTLTYISFLLCGLSTVFPWNVFINAKSYFDFKLDDNSTANSTKYEDQLEVFFGIGSQVTTLIVQILVTSAIHRISLDIRMYIPLCAMLVIFMVNGALAWVPTSDWLATYFYLTIGMVVLVSVFGAVFQASTFGLAGVFPKKFMHATMIGQGVGGVAVAIFEIIMLIIMSDERALGFIYFLCAVLVILATILVFAIMTREPFAMPYLEDAKLEDSLSVEVNRTKPMPPFLQISSKIYVPGLSVFLVFFVTLGSFPSVISLIDSSLENEKWSKFFTPVVCFLLFNLWDFIGRTSSFLQIPSDQHQWVILVLSFLRLGFYPLFAFCNIPANNRSYTTPFFVHDAYPMVFVTLFGFSNGYLGSLSVMYAPKLVSPEHQETAGAMMAFFITLGLALGSLSALVVLAVI